MHPLSSWVCELLLRCRPAHSSTATPPPNLSLSPLPYINVAGISTECNSLETCTEVAIGPCKDATAGPEYYINQYSHSLAFLSDADAYLTDSTKVVQAEKWSGLNVKGYRDVNGDKTEGTAKYAYIMTGAWYGSAVSGGYVGSGSYLMKSGTISTNKNTFYVSTTAGETAVTRDDSTFGAPIGPYQGCISPLTDGACGAARTFKTGDYKFSIYGFVRRPGTLG